MYVCFTSCPGQQQRHGPIHAVHSQKCGVHHLEPSRQCSWIPKLERPYGSRIQRPNGNVFSSVHAFQHHHKPCGNHRYRFRVSSRSYGPKKLQWKSLAKHLRKPYNTSNITYPCGHRTSPLHREPIP